MTMPALQSHPAAGATLGACLLLCAALGAQAQGLRDPTVPPASVASAPVSVGAAPGSALDLAPVAVIVRDGRPYLMVGTRLYAQGDMLGSARIERIGETELWLREGKVLRKRAVFNGIERRAAKGGEGPAECLMPAARLASPRRMAVSAPRSAHPTTRVPPPGICPP